MRLHGASVHQRGTTASLAEHDRPLALGTKEHFQHGKFKVYPHGISLNYYDRSSPSSEFTVSVSAHECHPVPNQVWDH